VQNVFDNQGNEPHRSILKRQLYHFGVFATAEVLFGQITLVNRHPVANNWGSGVIWPLPPLTPGLAHNVPEMLSQRK